MYNFSFISTFKIYLLYLMYLRIEKSNIIIDGPLSLSIILSCQLSNLSVCLVFQVSPVFPAMHIDFKFIKLLRV